MDLCGAIDRNGDKAQIRFSERHNPAAAKRIVIDGSRTSRAAILSELAHGD